MSGTKQGRYDDETLFRDNLKKAIAGMEKKVEEELENLREQRRLLEEQEKEWREQNKLSEKLLGES